jgi:hypothetical protein
MTVGGDSSRRAEKGADRSEELVNELWTRGRTSLPASLVVLLGSFAFLLPMLRAHAGAMVAYVLVIATSFARWVGALILSRRLDRTSLQVRYWTYAIGAVACAGSMGWVSLEGVRHLDLSHLGIWVLVVSGICGGATISIGSRPEVFFAYIGLMLTPLVVAPIVWPREGGALIAVASAVWALHSIVQVRQYFATRKGLLTLTTELDAKVRELDGNNRALARKNEELVELHQRADRIFSALADALPGKTLAGKYKLEDRIGTGGFAVVFRATHVDLGRRVAVKIFRPQSGNDSAAAFERFRLEGMSQGLVNHPNIVGVLDAGFSADGIAYIAMELLDGEPFAEELARAKRLAAPRVAWIMGQVCRALAAAHAIGIIHRDVKPENIFLHRGAAGDTVKLLDFGVAKVQQVARERLASLTVSGVLIGTPLYMAPERFMSESCDATADVYSVGVMMYRALAGRVPFEGTLTELMMRAVSEAPRPLREVAQGVDPRLESIVMQALAQDPRDRPTAAHMADFLEQYRVGAVA